MYTEPLETKRLYIRQFTQEDYEILVKKLKETPYYKITERIEKIGLRESLIDLSKVHLGHFEEIKNTLVTYFLET